MQDIAIGAFPPFAPFPVIKIVKYCNVWGGGGGGIGGGGGAKILQKIMAPTLSIIKIVKYCGVVGGGGALVALKSYKHNDAPSLSLRLLSIVASGEGGGHQNPIKNNGVPSLCHEDS